MISGFGISKIGRLGAWRAKITDMLTSTPKLIETAKPR